MNIHVSIHDVSPPWEREVRMALDETSRLGFRAALLVVPNFHGSAPLAENRAFCDSLVALQRARHPVYLHGLYHRGECEPSGTRGVDRLRWHWDQRVISGGEAEFSGLSTEEAGRRLDEGAEVLTRAGLTMDGFVAPAWCLPARMLPLLAARRFRYTEDRTHTYDPVLGRRRASVVLNFASRSRARTLSTVAYCRIARAAARFMPIRIAIHPGDMRVPLLRSELRRLLSWAARLDRMSPR